MAGPRQTRETNEIKAAHEEAERPALQAGHPVTWQILTQGTLLEGTAYPLPVFL